MAEGDKVITLFPTRLREFEEKNNLVFHHYLKAKNEFRRRSSDTPAFGDQYSRRRSSVDIDMIDPDDVFFVTMQNIFRRSSITKDQKNVKLELLETRLIPKIFARLGQEYDTEELRRWIKANDRHGLGVINFDAYQRICVHFVKDPEAIEKAKTEEFSFNNLINEEKDDSDDSDIEEEEEEEVNSNSEDQDQEDNTSDDHNSDISTSE